jgi:hypothetical protein
MTLDDKGKTIYADTKKETNTQACLSGLCTVPGPGGKQIQRYASVYCH